VSDTALASADKALFARLSGDTGAGGLMTKVTGVFDHVPDKQAYPYVTVGEAIETPDNTFGRNGHQDLFTFHVWSQKHGFAECYDIVNSIMGLLDDFQLVVQTPNHTTVSLQHEDTNSMRDPDGITRHVIVRFRWIGEDG
jgi:hypothetical protein